MTSKIRHRDPQPDLCPAKDSIRLNLCEENSFVNSKDEEPLKQYPKCDICFHFILDKVQ